MAENNQKGESSPQTDNKEPDIAKGNAELKVESTADKTNETLPRPSSDDSKAGCTPPPPAATGDTPCESVAEDGGLDIENLVVDNKNSKSLKCLRCGSTVLRPNNATYEKKEIYLPHMKKKKANQTAEDGETLSDHWRVEGMYTFENVGFTNTVNNIKYLICADCEVGPIGWYDPSDANNFYVAIERIDHA